jgi:hypothetical protein
MNQPVRGYSLAAVNFKRRPVKARHFAARFFYDQHTRRCVPGIEARISILAAWPVSIVHPKDLLQIATEGGEGPAMFSVELRSDAKESMNKTTLADHITFRQPTDLPLPDQMHRFVTIDRP